MIDCLSDKNNRSTKSNPRLFNSLPSHSAIPISLLNKVFHSDCLKILARIPDDYVDLVYMDPPFFSNRYHEAYADEEMKFRGFEDRWSDGLQQYVTWMSERLRECRRVLKSTGSLYVHCDWHASHYLKIELDKIFGYKNFQNEIIWRRHNAHNDSKQGAKMFGRVHDVLLFYSKSRNYVWNPIFQPYPQAYLSKYYRHTEANTGRIYALGDISGPGGRAKGNPKYEFLGVKRYWRFSRKNMRRLYREGKIVQTSQGTVPKLKRYLDEMPGIPMQDVWDDIQSVQIAKRESVKYPTQKPVRLLERIIEISTNHRGVVLDPFCGSGTTLVAARNLGRKFIGIDNNIDACRVSRNRLRTKADKKWIPEIAYAPMK